MSQLYKDAIFWVEVEKIQPNPQQPRRDFDEQALLELADSVRQYGVLQPLVVTRVEESLPDGSSEQRYELIAGERRWRASKLGGLKQVPVIVRQGDDDKLKLELAIIENVQREDLNAIERGMAFQKLAKDFGLTHTQVAKKVGKSREYVNNSIRLLSMPEYMMKAVRERKLSEGHARALLMLNSRPEQQETVFKDILYTKMTVRDTERVARQIAKERAKPRKDSPQDPLLRDYEERFSEMFGTSVRINQNKGEGGRLVIDFFDPKDLAAILEAVQQKKEEEARSQQGTISSTIFTDAPRYEAPPQPVKELIPLDDEKESSAPLTTYLNESSEEKDDVPFTPPIHTAPVAQEEPELQEDPYRETTTPLIEEVEPTERDMLSVFETNDEAPKEEPDPRVPSLAPRLQAEHQEQKPVVAVSPVMTNQAAEEFTHSHNVVRHPPGGPHPTISYP